MLVLTVKVQTDYTFQELWNSVPRGEDADETLAIIHEYGMDNDFMEYMASYYYGSTPDLFEVEQWLKYDRDNIFNAIELDFEAWEAEKEAAEEA